MINDRFKSLTRSNKQIDQSDATVSLSVNEKNEPSTKKLFKTCVNAVMKKIKTIGKNGSENGDLPDPSELPITSSCHLSVLSLIIPKIPKMTTIYQENYKEDIDLNRSLSKTGACVLYRDEKTRHCVVRDISNTTSCCGFFEWYSCYHLMPACASIIILDMNMNVVQAYNSLVDNHTRAAPVWDSVKQQFVDMFTITDFIKHLHKYYVADKSVLDHVAHDTIKDWRDLLENDTNERLIHVSPEVNIRYAASVIARSNIHRLPVIDPRNGNVLAIITNSQLFRFFYERFLMKGNGTGVNLGSITKTLKISIPSYFNEKISDLKLGNYNETVSTIHPWQTIYDAFDIFVKNHISVLPVVDDENRLIDIYARYDVIASIVETGKYLDLDCTIAETIKLRKMVRPPCTCSKNDSFAEILQMIYDAQVHRIFVVDSERHILGVISLTDVLSFLCMV